MFIWTLRIGAALALAWTFYNVSPYLALYDLARAVERRDVAAIERRVNLPSLRTSISRQVVAASIEAFGTGRQLDPSVRRLASETATALAEPLLGSLVTPQGIVDLLDDGWTEGAKPKEAAAGGGLSRASLENPWRVFLTSQSRGFRTVFFFFPLDRPAGERFRLRLQLSNWTWRLIDVDLPPALLRRLAEDLLRMRGSLDRTPSRASPIGLRRHLDDPSHSRKKNGVAEATPLP